MEELGIKIGYAVAKCGKSGRNIAAVALTILAIGSLVWTNGGCGANSTNDNPNVKYIHNYKSDTPPLHVIDAYKIIGDYHNNEVGADQKYKGKIFIVHGAIAEIGKDIMGTPFVRIGGDLKFIQCLFEDGSPLANLNKGDDIKISGSCDGIAFGMSIIFKNCEITY